jgi:DNA polymerase III delta prime subunit
MSTNGKIIGNKNIQQRFSYLLSQEGLSHAYIFYGPRFLGKKTFAQTLSLQFLSKDQEEEKQFFRYILPNEKHCIDVDVIRDVRREAQLGCDKKVFIIDDAHTMTTMAQNALLKILEEPRENIVFFLVTDAVGDLLPTVVSRCEKIGFQRVSMSDFSENFSSQEWKEYEAIARMAFGRPGIFFSLLDDEEKRKKREAFFRVFSSFEKRKVYEVMQFAKRLHEQPDKIREFLEHWIEYCRYECREGNISYDKAYKQADKIRKTLSHLKRTNASPRLLLESLFLSLLA